MDSKSDDNCLYKSDCTGNRSLKSLLNICYHLCLDKPVSLLKLVGNNAKL